MARMGHMFLLSWGGIQINVKQKRIIYSWGREKKIKPNQEEKEIRREGVYIGKTSRSLYERSKEHEADAKSFKEGSHIVKYWLSRHEEDKEQPEFIFKKISSHKDCLSRQIAQHL